MSFKNVLSTVSVASILCASAWGQAPAGQAQGQGQAAQGQTAQKQWKDRAEYDLYDSILKAQEPAKRLELLNQWRDKYATSNYAKERLLLYLDTYKNLNQAQSMYDTAKAILAIDPKDANVLLVLGVVADRQGKHDEAREAWQRAATLGGGNEIAAKARQNLANLDARLAGRAPAVQTQALRPTPAPTARARLPARTASSSSRASSASSRSPASHPTRPRPSCACRVAAVPSPRPCSSRRSSASSPRVSTSSRP